MAIAEIKWKLVKDTYFLDTTTCYLSENGNHLFYTGGEKQIEILIDDLNELVRKDCAIWLELGEYEFALDKLSKCPTQTWHSIHQMLYSLEPWGVIKESKESTRKSLKESVDGKFATDEDCNMSGKGWILEGTYNFIMEFLQEWGIAPTDVKKKNGMMTLYNADGNSFGYVYDDDEVNVFVVDKDINYFWKNYKPSTKRVKVIEMEND